MEQLDTRARASGTQWALGLAARSRALTSTGPDAEEHYREAIERLGRCRMATHLARTGATSKEVGAQLFLSPRTIDAHLRNIFQKLGITSRQQLRDLQLS